VLGPVRTFTAVVAVAVGAPESVGGGTEALVGGATGAAITGAFSTFVACTNEACTQAKPAGMTCGFTRTTHQAPSSLRPITRAVCPGWAVP
jgi:hypothetical protein